MIGYERFEHSGVLWREHHGTLIPLSMPHATEGLSREEAKKIVHQHGVKLIRWESDFDALDSSEWWHIIKTEPENIAKCTSKTRNQIRRGLRHHTYNRTVREFVLEHGYDVYRLAYERYHTFEPMYSKDKFCVAISSLPPETEFWVGKDKVSGEVVAFSENLVRDNACLYVTAWFTPESLRNYSSYGLFHVMNKHYLNERGLFYVSDGARSISHQTGIHDFLISKFGFRKAFANLNVEYAVWLIPIVFCLYPFRRVFRSGRLAPLRKISILLEQERIRRLCSR